MKPLLRTVVAVCLLVAAGAHPENIEEVKELPQAAEPVLEAEESNPQTRKERCTTGCISGGLKIDLKSPNAILEQLKNLPGGQVHTQSSFEGCSSERGCVGIKVKDGKILERYGNVDEFKAASQANIGNEFTFHSAGIPGTLPFWWMGDNSPFNINAGSYDQFAKTSSSFSGGASGSASNSFNYGLDLSTNPFLNGQVSGVSGNFGSGSGIGSANNPSAFQSSSFESSSFSKSSQGNLDLSKNQFPNAGNGFQVQNGLVGSNQGASGTYDSSQNAINGFSSSGFFGGSSINSNAGSYDQSAQTSSSLSGGSASGANSDSLNGNLDLSSNPFLNGQFSSISSQNAVNSFSSGNQFTGSSPRPFSGPTGGAGSNVNLIQNTQKVTDFNFESQQSQPNLGDSFQVSGNKGGVTKQLCVGQDYACVQRQQCDQDGIVISTSAVLQRKQFCDTNIEVCCRIEGTTTSGSFGQNGVSQSFGSSQSSGFSTTPLPSSFGSSTGFNSFEAASGTYGNKNFASNGFSTTAVPLANTNNVFGTSSGSFSTASGSFTSGSGSNFEAGSGSYGNNNVASSGFGSTISPFASTSTLFSTSSGNGNNQIYKESSQNNFRETGKFSTGSGFGNTYRPGSEGGLKPGIPYLPPVDNTIGGSNIVTSTVYPSTTPRPTYTPRPTRPSVRPSSTTPAPYLPPLPEGESSNRQETVVPPVYGEGGILLDEKIYPKPAQNIPSGCAAALKCTPIEFCTAQGVVSPTRVVLTNDQQVYRVPLTDCKDENGRIGKCCRDPDYTDPWPATVIGQWIPELFGDGKYIPEKRVVTTNVRRTTTQPPEITGSTQLNTNRVTTTPQTTVVKYTERGQGQYTERGQGQYTQRGQGEYTQRGQGQYTERGQGEYTKGGVGFQKKIGVTQYGSAGQGNVGQNLDIVPGGVRLTQQTPGTIISQGQGQIIAKEEGQAVEKGVGSTVFQGQGQIIEQGQGRIGQEIRKVGVKQQEAPVNKIQTGQVVSQELGQKVTTGIGQEITQQQVSQITPGLQVTQLQGQILEKGVGQQVTQGKITGYTNGQGKIATQGQGVIIQQGLGANIAPGYDVTQQVGTQVIPGSSVTQLQGQIVNKGKGQVITQGEGTGYINEQGKIITQEQGVGVNKGIIANLIPGYDVTTGEVNNGIQFQGAGVTQRPSTAGVTAGLGFEQGQGQIVNQGQGFIVNNGKGQIITEGQGVGFTQGEGFIVQQGQEQVVSQGFGETQEFDRVPVQGQVGAGIGNFVNQETEKAPSESEFRVVLKPYNAGDRCGLMNGQSPLGNPNDLEMDFAQIPWQAMVLLQTNKSLLCGGVITRPDVVVTTAACVQGLDAKNVLIKGGEWKLGIDEEPLPFQIVQVKHILRHPLYNPGNLFNDAAILVLTEDLRLAPNIYPICLPGVQESLEAYYRGEGQCIVTGWGKVVLQVHLQGALMHGLNVSLLSPGACENRLAQSFPHLLENYNQDTCICGEPSNAYDDICSVDIGSALACTSGDGHFVMRGLYSWDSGCQAANQLAAFYKFDMEWYQWAIGVVQSIRFTTIIRQISAQAYINPYDRQTISAQTDIPTGIGLQATFSTEANFNPFSVIGQAATSEKYTDVGGTGAVDQGPISNTFSATYTEKKIFRTEPKYVTYTTKPEIISYTTKPEIISYTTKPKIVTYTTKPEFYTYTTKPKIVTYTTKPEIFTYTTKPKIVTYTTKPEIITYTTKPEIVTYTTKPKIVTYTTKPKFISYTASATDEHPSYAVPAVSFNPTFTEVAAGKKHTHNAQCKCLENKK